MNITILCSNYSCYVTLSLLEAIFPLFPSIAGELKSLQIFCYIISFATSKQKLKHSYSYYMIAQSTYMYVCIRILSLLNYAYVHIIILCTCIS